MPDKAASRRAGALLTRRFRWLRLAMLWLIGLSFAVVISLVLQLRAELRQLQETPVDSLHWNVTQLELDVVRLETAAEVALIAPFADLAPLRQRYDLFYSRAGTVLAGDMFTLLGLSDTVAPLQKRMRDFLDVTTPLIDGDDAALRAGLAGLAQSVRDLRGDLRTMAIRVIDTNAALQDARRAEFTEILQEIALASLALVALLLALLALVVMLNRQADRRTREVRRVTSRLEATVGTALDAVIVAGLDGRVIDFNPAAEAMFGFRRTEAVGQPLGELIIPRQHRAAHEAGMHRMQTTGVKHVVDGGRIQISAIRKSGEEFPVELSIASNDGPDGMIFIAYLRDISDARKAEAALIAARDEAQAAEQTKTNFIAVMSHEMRTPLNGVIGALEILGRTPLKPNQERFVTLARNSAQHLLRHVNDVLDISRVDAGHATLQDDRFDLPSLVVTLIDPLRSAAAAKGLEIGVAQLADFPPLRGDPFRIGQIVQNFVSNAIKFTERGRIEIEADLHRIVDGRAEIELRVTDTGLGIAEADQERIFQDFVMVDPSHGRSVGGTGLGLAISRRIARAMGGEVGVESEPGAGSCFWLRLTLAVDAARPLPAIAPQPAAADPSPADTRPQEVLVVEDNETNRIVLDEMLRHLGHRVTLAVDGADGVEKARLARFDVILMDLSMPRMDGWAASAAIRAGGASARSRILAVTAHARPEATERMRTSGIDGWLTKPLTTRALAAVLGGGAQPVDNLPKVATLPLLDRERLAELSRISDAKGLSRLLETFRNELGQTLAGIEAGLSSQPLDDLAALGHSGAGTAAVIGAFRLRAELADLEALAKAGGRAEVQAAWPRLQHTWQATLAELNGLQTGPALPAGRT